MKNILCISIALIVLSSCEKIILGEDEVNSPENNFEILWNDLDKSYSLFEAKNKDWDNLYSIYRPQVTRNTTDEELWTIMSNLLEQLDDSHVTLYTEDESDYFISGYSLNEQSKKEFSENLITTKYLDSRTDMETEENLSYGKIKNKDIGYIYLGAEGGENPAIIDGVVDALKNHQAIIFDIRQNIGGDDRYAKRIAGVFADSESIIYSVQTRNGINHNDFDQKKYYSTEKKGDEQFLKPVILLTDRRTISAGEIFCLHMKSYNHITQIGDTTAGDFATTGNRSFLPNGWNYKFPVQLFLYPNGNYLDGNGGNVPDVYIKNSESDIIANEDKVIEKAIQYLFEEYGIQ
jgi:C-terminal processing protease CtpA/Prc